MDLNKRLLEFYKKNFKLKKFYNHIPYLDKKDQIELSRCIKSTFVSTAGKKIKDFEYHLKKITGSRYVIPVNSGTSALHLCLLANEIKEQNEVLIPSVNFVATANAITYVKADPHFIDVSRNDLTIDFKKLDNYLSSFSFKKGFLFNKKTNKYIKALVILHTFGYVANLKEAKRISKKYNLVLIEDAAEALGSYYKKIHVGVFGKCSVLSFNGNKIITTGAGGAVLTNNKKIYKKALHLSQVAKLKKPYVFDYSEVGYNYRMPNLNASLGISQLKKFKKILNLKRKLHNKYNLFFKQFLDISLIRENINTKSNHWLNTIIINKRNINQNFQKSFLDHMNKNNIQIRPMWRPLHKLFYLKKFPKMNLSNTNYLEKRVYNLPSSAEIVLNEKK
jgi:perosamine synthetase